MSRGRTISALRSLAAAISLAASSTSSLAQAPDCDLDVDACVVYAIAENAAFAGECGKLYPDARIPFDAAFADWSVTKLPIPGISAALDAGSGLRRSLGGKVAAYLGRIPGHEREIECEGRFNTMREKEPKVFADSVRLPPNVLSRDLK